MQQQAKDLSDYLAIFRRRGRPFLVTVAALFLISVAVAIMLPPVYRSTATILIEQQEIPSDWVRSTISSYADQRIQVISQHVMSHANLKQIIEKYGLYPGRGTGKADERKLKRLRRDITLDIVRVDVTDQHSGNKTAATIAFTLSYDGETARAAQNVANELITLFLNENLKSRHQRTAETSSFLAEEAAKLSQQISETEARLAAFKAKNMGRLPEHVQLNMQIRDGTDNEIKEVDRQIGALEERKFYLEGQLAQVKPNTPIISATGERIFDSSERLRILQAQYTSLAGVYSTDHPDMVRMRREIDALQKETGDGGELQEESKQLVRLRADLAIARDKYSDDHPDIIRLKKSIAALEAAAPSSNHARAQHVKPENPAFIALRSQLDAINSEMKSLRQKRTELRSKIASYELRLAETPQVERGYLTLTRDHENSLKRYQEIKANQMQAQIAEELERNGKGERFTLLDPPQLPEQPTSPNRPAILLLGMILSLGGGVAYVGVLESLDDSVRSSKTLAGLLKAPLLGIIPYVKTIRRAENIGPRATGVGSGQGSERVDTASSAGNKIVYTQTRRVDISRELLRGKRLVSGFDQCVLTDAFKILSTQVSQRLHEKGWNTLAVTSAGEGEGKTFTAINLAISFAMEFHQTALLVDADLRKPSVREYFGLPPGPGLSDYLISNTPIEQLLIHPGIEDFVILPGGTPLSNSSEVLGWRKMAELVKELKSRYSSRIVLFDLPSLLPTADVLAFAPCVDAALLVVEEGRSRRADVSRAGELLGSTHLIGTILNKCTAL